MNGTLQLLAYVDVNLLGDNIDIINKSTEILIHASEKVGVEIHIEKTMYMLLSPNQNAGQNQDINTGNRSSENVSQLKYFGMTVTNKNLLQEKIKGRLNFGNACYQLSVFLSTVKKHKN
jgi:hypothetical protein